MTSKAVPALLVLAAAACQREAAAQVTRDPLAPVRCYSIAIARQLSSDSALQLCGGVPSDGPGRCYATGLDLAPTLSSQQLLQLCASATSTEPISCFLRLDAEGDLTDDQQVRYCETRCPLGPPPPEASSAACLARALDTDLADQTAGELCRGSSSDGPVQCYLAGDDFEQLTDSQLVVLCAESRQCQYYNAESSGY